MLDTCKNFLKDHPSETIILYLADEVTDSDQVPRIRARAKGILQSLANETNPSTGESYLYMEGGAFAPYTAMPKVGDVQGKIVIASNSAKDFACHGYRDTYGSSPDCHKRHHAVSRKPPRLRAKMTGAAMRTVSPYARGCPRCSFEAFFALVFVNAPYINNST